MKLDYTKKKPESFSRSNSFKVQTLWEQCHVSYIIDIIAMIVTLLLTLTLFLIPAFLCLLVAIDLSAVAVFHVTLSSLELVPFVNVL